MKISYAVTVCNEIDEIKKLIPFLIEKKHLDDEVVVLVDLKNGTADVIEFLGLWENDITVIGDQFDGHFANWKNKLSDNCSGDYIFQIDADEIPHESLIENIREILGMNNVDVVLVPRVNTVDGLTNKHIQKWGWRLSKMESLIGEKEMDTTSGEYKLLKKLGYIIEELGV
jgi:cellulose synthase/poly-beta-1,6-N-acetylglucosamine synthase-like glycosyltransferase